MLTYATMRLRTKFLLAICSILLLSFGVTFYRVSRFQDELLITQTERQARMLSHQIILTRKWIADHNGLFIAKTDGVEANPFLDDPEIMDKKGQLYVKRNPAMVTRELSEYARDSYFCQFRVTSLKPVNPLNAPDQFETASLLRINMGENEVSGIETTSNGRVLRYITPLRVEEPCLGCHGQHGYQVGDVRGGLSLSIPLQWADEAIARNHRMLFLIALGTVLLVTAALYLLIARIVSRPIGRLSQAIKSLPNNELDIGLLPDSGDEIGELTRHFVDLHHRLADSQEKLEKTREQMFLAEKLAALGRLSAGIAHEINNPLGGMRNCIKSMREEPANTELCQRYLPLLDKGLERVSSTMRQLLNFGREAPLKLSSESVDELIRECFSLLSYRMKHHKLILDLHIPGTQIIDSEALRQIIVNIGLNAIQATPESGTITVTSSRNAENFTISIADTGAGIAPEIRTRIFDPFFTTKKIGEGTGLGLAVSFSLAKKMSGTIDVESSPENGSSFIIRIPIRTPVTGMN